MAPDTALPAFLSVILWVASTAVGALVAFFAFQRAVDRKFGDIDVRFAEAKIQAAKTETEHVRLDTDLKGELRLMNEHLESIDDWISNLRKRSHEMIEKFQELFLKVDRIEHRGHQVRKGDKM